MAFNFHFEDTRTIHVPKKFVMENIVDFDHVNYVHKRCYAYCRVIARARGVTLVEYGVRHIPGFPLVTHYTMHHEYHPPDTVIHYARAGGKGPWTKSMMHVSDIETEAGPATLYRHTYDRMLPIWMKPFQPLMTRLIKWWTGILWEEDRSVVERRYKMSKAGFQDSARCADWVYEHGTGAYRFRRPEVPSSGV